MFDWVDLLETGRKAAGVDASLGSDGELFDAARSLEALRCAVDAAEGHVLAELDRRKSSVVEFGLTTGPWLAHDTQIPPCVARRRVKVAVRLSSLLSEVDAALTAGEISWDHARVIAEAANGRMGDIVASVQGQLLDLAVGGDVVDVAPADRFVASGEHAAAVTDRYRPALRRVSEPDLAAHVLEWAE